MFGDIGWFGETFGATPDGAIEHNLGVARAAVRQGLAVVLLKPGTKLPICILNQTERKKADREAQRIAQEAGSPNWEHVKHECGIKHAIIAETAFTRKAAKEALAAGANLAVAIGAGTRRVIVVDIDTADQRAAFLTQWGIVEAPLTVTSPGSKKDGEWIHKDGGHYWFDVPEGVELPVHVGKHTDPSGWCAYYGSGYVLVPPSVREEGPYTLTGECLEAPQFLLDAIQGAGKDYKPADLKHETSDVNTWSSETSWEELLTEDGWHVNSERDNCGCPTFTRPGSPAHAKSATGHEAGCTKYDTIGGHAPMHIWSDALRATFPQTVSKLNYVAIARYLGDVSVAMIALGIQTEAPPAPEFKVEGVVHPKGFSERLSRALNQSEKSRKYRLPRK